MAKKEPPKDPERTVYVVWRIVPPMEKDAVRKGIVGWTEAQKIVDKLKAEETEPGITYVAEEYEPPHRTPRRRGGPPKVGKIRKKR